MSRSECKTALSQLSCELFEQSLVGFGEELKTALKSSVNFQKEIKRNFFPSQCHPEMDVSAMNVGKMNYGEMNNGEMNVDEMNVTEMNVVRKLVNLVLFFKPNRS